MDFSLTTERRPAGYQQSWGAAGEVAEFELGSLGERRGLDFELER